jgi:hypothetical protein
VCWREIWEGARWLAEFGDTPGWVRVGGVYTKAGERASGRVDGEGKKTQTRLACWLAVRSRRRQSTRSLPVATSGPVGVGCSVRTEASFVVPFLPRATAVLPLPL